MVSSPKVKHEAPRYVEAKEVLAEHRIDEGPHGYSAHQLSGELTRRGWQVRLHGKKAEAIKSYTPKGTVTKRLVAQGDDPVAALAIALADAIRFDEESGPAPAEAQRADLEIHGPEGWPLALVEVRNPDDLTAEQAVEWRRHFLQFGLEDQRYPFFLLVSQDAGYLWSQGPHLQPDDPPHVAFPMQQVIAHYSPRTAVSERVYVSVLEMAVANWLSGLAGGYAPTIEVAETPLRESGFLDAIKDATVHMDEGE